MIDQTETLAEEVKVVVNDIKHSEQLRGFYYIHKYT